MTIVMMMRDDEEDVHPHLIVPPGIDYYRSNVPMARFVLFRQGKGGRTRCLFQGH
jgi:hypothetical protein